MILAMLATLLYVGAVLIFLIKAFLLHWIELSTVGMIVTGAFIVFTVLQGALFLRTLARLDHLPRLTLDVREIGAVAGGALGTAILIRVFSFSPVAASGMVGILGSFLVPVYPFSVFCGSFIGMTSPMLLNYSQILLAALIGGVVFMFGRHGFHGMGG